MAPYQIAALRVRAAWSKLSGRQRILVCAQCLLTVACIGWVISSANEPAPVANGASSDFWTHIAQVDLNGKRESNYLYGGCYGYPPQGEWFFYYDQGFHGQRLYRVEKGLVEKDLPFVIAGLQQSDDRRREWVDPGFSAWLSLPREKQTAASLQAEMRRSYVYWWAAQDLSMAASFAQDEAAFLERWRRAQRYWINVVFEAAWLSLMIDLILRPWIRPRSMPRRALHIAVAPSLLFLPYFIGYVPLTFTSAYPVGGVVYPFVLRLAAMPMEPMAMEWAGWEVILADSPIGALLAPLNQESGPMLSLSGGGSVSPTTSAIAGLVAAGGLLPVVLYWRLLVYRWRSQFHN